MEYGELEIGLGRKDGVARTYQLEMRFVAPGSDVEDRLPNAVDIAIPDNLFHPPVDLTSYGAGLSNCLFQDTGVYTRFVQWRENSRSGLRVRLYIKPGAEELHAVHWEAMTDPQTADSPQPLFSSDTVAFSRYLADDNFSEVSSREHQDVLNVLIVVANPSDLRARGYDEIDVTSQVKRVTDALNKGDDRFYSETLAEPMTATLDGIFARLKAGPKIGGGFDILYLICHGLIIAKGAFLILEKVVSNADGTTAGVVDPVSGALFVQGMRALQVRPRLIVMASCQSAGAATATEKTPDEERQLFGAALGPRLSEAGIPAVLAMSGNMGQQAAEIFVPKFFTELVSVEGDGQIDRAVSLGRNAILGNPQTKSDAWRPTLFMRLKTGRIWYQPGFRGGDLSWGTICKQVRKGKYVPVLGPGVPAVLEGSEREHASKLAASPNGFPLAESEIGDLRKVAQYISFRDGPRGLRDDLRDARAEGLRARFPNLTSADDYYTMAKAVMDEVFTSKDYEDNPYRVLTDSSLLQPSAGVYLTLNSDPFLRLALKKAGRGGGGPLKDRVSGWYQERDDAGANTGTPDPTPEQPAIFYVYGASEVGDEIWEQKDIDHSWVLTEDDVYDYLLGMSKLELAWPVWATNAISRGTMIFLGFPVEHWKLRLLLRSILKMGCSASVLEGKHYCVQVNPEETAMSDARRAMRYFEDFSQKQQISIYWGSAKDFLKQLRRELAAGTGS